MSTPSLLIGPLFQNHVNNFTVYMLLLQNTTSWSWQLFSLLWIDKARAKDKTYKWVSVWWETEWVSVWWKTKNQRWEIYTSLIHWVVRETGTPKYKDEVNRREVSECDGWVCDRDCILRKDVDHIHLNLWGYYRAVEVEESTGRMNKLNSWSFKKEVSFPMGL
jgi:hypothetical protein